MEASEQKNTKIIMQNFGVLCSWGVLYPRLYYISMIFSISNENDRYLPTDSMPRIISLCDFY